MVKFKVSSGLKKTLIGGVALLVVGVLAFVVWASQALGPGDSALRALRPDERVAVHRRSGDWHVFTPNPDSRPLSGDSWSVDPLRYTRAVDRGIILYPGGRVDSRSYAPLARRFADRGYTVVVVSAPLNIMLLASDRAATIAGVYPDVEKWTLVGHSLGAAAASRLIDRAEPVDLSTYGIDSLVLLAGYPASSWDISGKPVSVLSITAEYDRVLDRDAWERARSLLPPDTRFHEISGGNHAGFADYGEQPGDGEARISRSEQIDRTVELVLEFIE